MKSCRLAFALLAACAWVPAQTATFRAGTEEVLVDAVARDKKGNFQRDLTQKEFHLFEDGKEQTIASFSLESARLPGHFRPHFLTLFFESELPGLREEVAHFVDRYAAPDLYMAIYSQSEDEIHLRLGFTADAARIKAALKAMPVASAPGDKKGPVPRHLFDRISSVATELAPVRGRKALILFSYGFVGGRQAANPAEDGEYRRAPVSPLATAVTQAVDVCNEANVSLYAFRTERGFGPTYGDYYHAPEKAEDQGAFTDFIADIARGTGGKYTPPGTYDLASYLGSIPVEEDDFYLLGYTPSAVAASKPCHKIKVKVDRSGVDVNARDSYCVGGQPAPPKSVEKTLEARAASGDRGNMTPGLQLSWFYSKPGAAMVDVETDLDPHALKVRGRHVEFDVSGVAYREDGSAAARTGGTVKVDFNTQAELDDFLKAPYRYSTQFDLAPDRYRFRLAVGSGDSFGVVEKPLEIAPWSGETLSASGIALGAKAYQLTGVTAELDNSLLEGPRRLAADGMQIVPLGGSVFPAGANGVLYFELYQSEMAQAAPTMRMRIIDRATGEQKADSGPVSAAEWMKAGHPATPISLTLPIANLTAGAYRLELRVMQGNGEDGVVRTADFEVNANPQPMR